MVLVTRCSSTASSQAAAANRGITIWVWPPLNMVNTRNPAEAWYRGVEVR